MKPLDYILIAAVAVGFVAAIVLMIRAKRRGKTCCCSSGDCCGDCATCRAACAGRKKEDK